MFFSTCVLQQAGPTARINTAVDNNDEKAEVLLATKINSMTEVIYIIERLSLKCKR